MRIWTLVAASLLLVSAGGLAQENGHSSGGSRPATRKTGPDTRESTSRPVLDAALAELRKAQTSSSAALAAKDAYNLGEAARAALLDICREKTVAEATFEGIVSTFEYVHDRSILPIMVEVYGTGEAVRERFLTERFRTFDAQRSMFEDLFSELEKAAPGARRRTLLRILGEIVDTPAERMQASRFLVLTLQRSEFRDDADEVKAALQKVTFHDFSSPALWQKWFEAFVAAHPEGFAEADLFASALKDRDQRFIAEVKRSISVAIASKQVPTDYFDPIRYPEASIRVHAAIELGGLKEADPDVVKQASKALLEALSRGPEKDDEVVCALLRSIGALAENRDEIKALAAPQLLPFLKDERDMVVVAALKAIAQTGTGSDCHVIEDLYSSAAISRKDRAAVRAQVVTTLYSLDCGSPAIVTALEDVSADVRASAARGLGYGRRTESVSQIAKALKGEKNEEAQRVMVRSLVALQKYPAEVVDALMEVAAKPGPARDAAVRGLVQAGSAGQISAAKGESLVSLLSEALPALAAAPDKRKALMDDLQAAKGPLLTRVLMKWLETEPQGEVAKDVASVLAKMSPPDAELLQGYAKPLIAAGRPSGAVVLLRAAVEAAAGNGGSSQPSRHAELKVALARALLLEKSSDGLTEAESIASQELRLRPEDGQILMLRGAIREALGRRFEAAEDMRRALRTEGVVMADPQRQEAERKTALLLLDEDPKKAKEFLDGLPPMSRDRDFLVVLGRVEMALGDRKTAATHLRSALKAVGKEDTGVVRYYLTQALLGSRKADDLLEAKSLFDALDAESALPEGYPLQPLRTEIQANAAARTAVRNLDEGSQEGIGSLTNVITIGARALPWLVQGFADLARTGALTALERRNNAIQSILGPDAAATRTYSALAAPENGAARDAWIEFAPRLADWWDKRR